MRIVDYFAEEPRHLIPIIESADWSAAKLLASLLRQGTFQEVLDGGTLYLLMDGEEIVSFVTLTGKDCIDAPDLRPWMGFFYTFPAYRGHRYGGKLLAHVARKSREQGYPSVYLATDHQGLYEKYGFTYLCNRVSIYGDDSRIYVI